MMMFRYVRVASMMVGFAGCIDSLGDDGSTSAEPNESTASQDLVDRSDYTLVGLGGKCMDVAWGASDNGTAVNLFDCNGTPAQRWHWSGSSTNGQFMAFGKCLDIPSSGIYDRNHLQLWDCNGSGAQKFDLFERTVGSLEHLDTIRPAVDHNFCVEVAGGFTDNWTPIQLFDCNGTTSQQWYAVSADQNPSTAPWGPSIQFITVRDHRGGTVVDVPSIELTDRSLFETSFTWYRRVPGDSQSWQNIGTTPALTGVGRISSIARPPEYTNRQYDYKVVATNPAGSTDSNIISVGPPPPAAPSNLHVTAITENSISLAWNDNSNNEIAFEVYATCCVQPYNSTQSSTTVVGLPSATQICFVVWAFGGTGDSPESNYVCATTMPPVVHTGSFTVGLGKFTAPNSSVYYQGGAPIVGTVTTIHVPLESPVNGVYFVKPAYTSATACYTAPASAFVYAAPGTDLDLNAYYGTNRSVYNPVWQTCDTFSSGTGLDLTSIQVTYTY